MGQIEAQVRVHHIGDTLNTSNKFIIIITAYTTVMHSKSLPENQR